MRLSPWLILVAFAGSLGCEKRDRIEKYSAKVVQEYDPALAQNKANKQGQAGENPAMSPKMGKLPDAPPAGEPVPTRLLGAMIPVGTQTWFFKMTGPPSLLAKLEPQFQELIQSVELKEDAAKPIVWKLPEGWKQGEERAMRFATLIAGKDGETAELSISRFGGELKENINRWRQQLSLEPFQEIGDEVYRKTVNKKKVSDRDVYIIDLTGKMDAASNSMMPPKR